MPRYDERFYARLEGSGDVAAKRIVPLILDLFDAKSVVDVGCGIGRWLLEFAHHGLEIHGVDQDRVPPELLLIPADRFTVHDLQRPLDLGRRFDLAVSLEVAEHLPERCADDFVASLAGLAPAIAFSAAIPFQSGTGHVNMQWPTYWSEKFARHGYRTIDGVRRKVWNDAQIPDWYRQNLLLYAHEDCIRAGTRLHEELQRTCLAQLDIVLPEVYSKKAWPSMKRTFKLLRSQIRAKLHRPH